MCVHSSVFVALFDRRRRHDDTAQLTWVLAQNGRLQCIFGVILAKNAFEDIDKTSPVSVVFGLAVSVDGDHQVGVTHFYLLGKKEEMTTQINNSAKYLTSLRVGSLQVGRTNASTQFSLPVRIGLLAGTNLVSGGESVVVGDYSCGTATTEIYSVVVGARTGNSVTIGNYNVLIGWTTARALAGGRGDVIIGAGAATTSGTVDYGTAVGFNATVGAGCTSVGANTFGGTASSIYNTFIGHQNGTVTCGNYNTVTGSYAARVGTGAWSSVCAFGYGALGSGSKTVAIDGTCAFGRSALAALTTGSYNSVFGHTAGATVTTGSSNTLMGYAAGHNLSGSNNTIIGASPVTGTVSGCVTLGAGATSLSNTFTVCLQNGTTYFDTNFLPATQGTGYQNCPTDCAYINVFFNGVQRRILVYNNA